MVDDALALFQCVAVANNGLCATAIPAYSCEFKALGFHSNNDDYVVHGCFSVGVMEVPQIPSPAEAPGLANRIMVEERTP
jgi:hypothetical protein